MFSQESISIVLTTLKLTNCPSASFTNQEKNKHAVNRAIITAVIQNEPNYRCLKHKLDGAHKTCFRKKKCRISFLPYQKGIFFFQNSIMKIFKNT